jgi:peptidoglycan/LPS O-acetylase OafA/YrhL
MLINIQFLRFLAALAVVFYHAAAHVKAIGADPGPIFALGRALGFAGVDVFFVISGFIMVHTTGGQQGAGEAGDFLRRRVARIYSGYWPFFLIAVAMIALLQPERLPNVDLLASFTLWPAANLALPVSWTLTYEMIFYLGFTLLLFLPETRRHQVILAGLVVILAWSAWSFWIRGDYRPGRLEQLSLAQAWLTSPFLAEFLAGAVAARWLKQHPDGRAWTWLLAGLALILLGGWLNVVHFEGGLEQGYQQLYRVLAYGPGALLILVGAVRLERHGVIAPRRLSLALGGSSYALYLSHTLFFWGLADLGVHAVLIGRPDLLVQFVYLGLSAVIVVLSWVHYRVVERSFHGLLRRLLHVTVKRRPTAVPGADSRP